MGHRKEERMIEMGDDKKIEKMVREGDAEQKFSEKYGTSNVSMSHDTASGKPLRIVDQSQQSSTDKK